MGGFDLWKRYIAASTGWKKAAKVNCALLISMSIILLIFYIVVVVRTGDFVRVLFFSEAACASQRIPVLNLFLHLLINIASTLVVSPSLY
jgi:hypothetical protein